MATNDRIRASDADRERVTTRLRDHFAEGRLTQDELDERVTAALNAKTLGDLRDLMTDLPESELLQDPARAQPQAAGGRVVLVPRGPRLLPLLIMVAFISVLFPRSGLVVFAVLQFFLVLALLALAFAVVQAARFRRRIRRHWANAGYRRWGYPL
jgi:Domain of unknown function (DUF1707)